MSYRHCAVWIDHKEARIFRIEGESFAAEELEAPTHRVHRHPRGAEEPSEHPEDTRRFFHDVTRALEGAEQILIVGPSTAKQQFRKYVHEHAPTLEPRIVGVETVDHPSDRQMAAYARTYFAGAERRPKPVT